MKTIDLVEATDDAIRSVNDTIRNINTLLSLLVNEDEFGGHLFFVNQKMKENNEELCKLIVRWLPLLFSLEDKLTERKIALRNIAYKFSTEDNVKDTE